MPSETPRGGCTRDSVSRQAENAIKLKSSIELIEQTVLEVAGKALYKPLLLNVTEGIAYEYLGKVPCGRRQFYEIRQKFFYTLSKKRG